MGCSCEGRDLAQALAGLDHSQRLAAARSLYGHAAFQQYVELVARRARAEKNIPRLEARQTASARQATQLLVIESVKQLEVGEGLPQTWQYLSLLEPA